MKKNLTSFRHFFCIVVSGTLVTGSLIFAQNLDSIYKGLSAEVRGGILFDDNILLSEDDETDDIIFSLSPSITLQTSDPAEEQANQFRLTYNPVFSFFIDESDFDSDEHSVTADFVHQSEITQLGLQVSYDDLAGNLVEFSDRVDRQVLGALLQAAHELSGKTELELTAALSDYDYDDFADVLEYYGQIAALYLHSDKLKFGPGFRYGQSDVDNGPDQDFYRAVLRADYNNGAKFTATGSAGIEVREFDGAGAEDDNEENFVFDLIANYGLSETVSLLCEVYRRDHPSSVRAGNNFIATGILAGISVEVLQSVIARVEASYENSDYYNTTETATSERDDDYVDVKVALDYTSPQNLQLGIFYRHRNNDSTIDAVEFENNQVGAHASLTF